MADSQLPPVAANLVAAREAQGLSQADAARLLRMKPAQLNKLERGVNVPGPKTLERIAHVYGIPDWTSLAAPRSGANPAAASLAGATAREGTAALSGDRPGVPSSNEELPGFWVGYLAGVHEAIANANSRLASMIAAGDRWEAATVRMVTERRRVGAGRATPPSAADDEALAAEVEQQLGRLTADEARAIVARYQARTGE